MLLQDALRKDCEQRKERGENKKFLKANSPFIREKTEKGGELNKAKELFEKKGKKKRQGASRLRRGRGGKNDWGYRDRITLPSKWLQRQ